MPSDPSIPPQFTAATTRRLRKAGLAGTVKVTVTGPQIRLDGEAGGTLVIPIETVKRIRVGVMETKVGRIFQTLVWRGDDERPILLRPLAPYEDNYAATVLAIAAVLAEDGRSASIERGTSAFDAVLGPILMGLLTMAASVVAIFILTDGTWWQRGLVPAFPLALFALLLFLGATRHWPRPIRSETDLLRHLPR